MNFKIVSGGFKTALSPESSGFRIISGGEKASLSPKIIDFPKDDSLKNMSLDKVAQESLKNQAQGLKAIPGALFRGTPFGQAARLFQSKEKQKETAARDLEAINYVLQTLARVPSAIQAGAFPFKGQSRIESAGKAFLVPEKLPAGYMGQEVTKRLPTPINERGAAINTAIGGTLGTLGDLASWGWFNKYGTALKAGFKHSLIRGRMEEFDKTLNEATKVAIQELEKKGAFPREWTSEDKFKRAKVWVKENITRSAEPNTVLNPVVAERLTAPPTIKEIGNILKRPFMGQRGEAALPAPESPKPKDLAKLAGQASSEFFEKKTIPDFKSTEEAMKFGLENKDNPQVIEALKNKREELKTRVKELMSRENATPEEESEAFLLAQKAQFPREALEAASEKKVKVSTEEATSKSPAGAEIVEPGESQGQIMDLKTGEISKIGEQLELRNGTFLVKKENGFQVLAADGKSVLSEIYDEPHRAIKKSEESLKMLSGMREVMPEEMIPSKSQGAETQKQLNKKSTPTPEEEQEAFTIAQKAQFPREALEAAGKPPALPPPPAPPSIPGGEEENIPFQGKPVQPRKVKSIIEKFTGIAKTAPTINIKEDVALRSQIQSEARTAKESYKAGKEAMREKAMLKHARKLAEKEAKQRFTPQQRKELYQVAWAKGLIIEKADHTHRDRLQPILSHYKNASFVELKNFIANLQGSQENPNPKILKLYGDINKDGEAMKLINEANKEWRDLNDWEVLAVDPIRQAEAVSGLDAWDNNNLLTQNIFDVISGADSLRFDRLGEELKELHTITKGILSNTKASAEIMRKFETKEPLSAHEKQIVDFLRSKYDMLISEANAMRARIGRKPIPYRQDYMTHIRDHNLLHDFFHGDTRQMEGITNDQLDAIRKGDFTKGNMKFNQFAQQRTGLRTKLDAIGNYEKYLETLLYEIYITPAVTHVRKFSEYALLRFPKMYEATTMLLNRMVGKPSLLDKFAKPFVSNKLVKWMRSRIASNALTLNISFNLVNAANFTTSVGELGGYTLKGIGGFLGNKELRKLAFEKSSVLKSRKNQFDADVRAIDLLSPESLEYLTAVEKARVARNQLRYIVEGITRVIEYNNVGSIWVGAYMKAIDKFHYPPDQAYKYADTIARRTQTGYRNYELPAVMASDSGKLLLQFQTWTFNAMNHLIYDMKLGNIPKQITKPFTKDNRPSRGRYRDFLVLVATMMFVNEIYRRMGLREPTSPTSIMPRVSFPMRRTFQSAGVVTGLDNIFTGRAVKHKPETKQKHFNRLLTTLGLPYGGTQVSRFIEGEILPKKYKTKKRSKNLIKLKRFRGAPYSVVGGKNAYNEKYKVISGGFK